MRGHRPHAHQAGHTAVSITIHNGIRIQEISDAVSHKSIHVTGTVYRHVIAPAIRGGATVMDRVFKTEDALGNGSEHRQGPRSPSHLKFEQRSQNRGPYWI